MEHLQYLPERSPFHFVLFVSIEALGGLAWIGKNAENALTSIGCC